MSSLLKELGSASVLGRYAAMDERPSGLASIFFPYVVPNELGAGTHALLKSHRCNRFGHNSSFAVFRNASLKGE